MLKLKSLLNNKPFKKPNRIKERKSTRKRKLLQLNKKLQNQLQRKRLPNMRLKSRNNTLNQKSTIKSKRKKKLNTKKRSRLRPKNNQLKSKRRKLLRHQPRSRHQPQLQPKRSMLTKIHTMRKNTHPRMTKPL